MSKWEILLIHAAAKMVDGDDVIEMPSGIYLYYFKTDKTLEFVDTCIYIFWNNFVILNLSITEDGINI